MKEGWDGPPPSRRQKKKTPPKPLLEKNSVPPSVSHARFQLSCSFPIQTKNILVPCQGATSNGNRRRLNLRTPGIMTSPCKPAIPKKETATKYENVGRRSHRSEASRNPGINKLGGKTPQPQVYNAGSLPLSKKRSSLVKKKACKKKKKTSLFLLTDHSRYFFRPFPS